MRIMYFFYMFCWCLMISCMDQKVPVVEQVRLRSGELLFKDHYTLAKSALVLLKTVDESALKNLFYKVHESQNKQEEPICFKECKEFGVFKKCELVDKHNGILFDYVRKFVASEYFQSNGKIIAYQIPAEAHQAKIPGSPQSPSPQDDLSPKSPQSPDSRGRSRSGSVRKNFENERDAARARAKNQRGLQEKRDAHGS